MLYAICYMLYAICYTLYALSDLKPNRSYVEEGFDTDLDRLFYQDDGFFDKDTALRGSVGADAVVLVVADTEVRYMFHVTLFTCSPAPLLLFPCPLPSP
jgi:hypothetical protein